MQWSARVIPLQATRGFAETSPIPARREYPMNNHKICHARQTSWLNLHTLPERSYTQLTSNPMFYRDLTRGSDEDEAQTLLGSKKAFSPIALVQHWYHHTPSALICSCLTSHAKWCNMLFLLRDGESYHAIWYGHQLLVNKLHMISCVPKMQ